MGRSFQASINIAGYVNGADHIQGWVPLPNADKYATLSFAPLNARGTRGMLFNSANLPTAYSIVNKSACGFWIDMNQVSPNSADQYKVAIIEVIISASR